MSGQWCSMKTVQARSGACVKIHRTRNVHRKSETPKRRYEKKARAAQEQATRMRIVDAAIDLHRIGRAGADDDLGDRRARGRPPRHRLPPLPRRARADARLLRDLGRAQPAARPRRVGRRAPIPARGSRPRSTRSTAGTSGSSRCSRRCCATPRRCRSSRRSSSGGSPTSPLSRTRSRAGWGARGTAARRLRATLGLALDFLAWRALHERGLSRADAIAVMASAVRAAAG